MIWSDAISSFRKHQPHKNWKFTLFIYITWMNALNLWTVILWVKYFNILNIPKISIDIFPGTLVNGFLTFSCEFALPFALINYFMIFYNNRYESIVEKYHNIKFRFAPVYSILSALLALFSSIIYGVLKGQI
jgi:hypothetical protein